jgi:hypothetical protein
MEQPEKVLQALWPYALALKPGVSGRKLRSPVPVEPVRYRLN